MDPRVPEGLYRTCLTVFFSIATLLYTSLCRRNERKCISMRLLNHVAGLLPLLRCTQNDANRYDARQNGRKDRSRVLTNLLPAAAVADVRE